MAKIRTNVDDLVALSVRGQVTSPLFGPRPQRIGYDGTVRVVPGTGGISYNVRVGDSATRWVADHVEPGVSLHNLQKDAALETSGNHALNVLACVGNRATVWSGPCEGEEGVVTGKHGGVEHVLLDFPTKVLEKMRVGDKIGVWAFGTGLALPDHPAVALFNMDPALLDAWEVREGEDGLLEVPVARNVPAAIMGSGLGKDQVVRGDYDIQLFDEQVVEEYDLASLRLGDFVAILDADSTHGRHYMQGAVTVGIVVHGSSAVAGHGPGVCSLMSSGKGAIRPVPAAGANLADLLGLR